MTTVALSDGFGTNFDNVDVATIFKPEPNELGFTNTSASHFEISFRLASGTVIQYDKWDISGFGFTYGSSNTPTGGVITSLELSQVFEVGSGGGVLISIRDLSVPATDLLSWASTGNQAAFSAALFGGADSLVGSQQADLFRAIGGDDVLQGRGGGDTLDGGGGADVAVYASSASDYSVSPNADGSVSVVDLRPGSPEGSDILINVESLRFAGLAANLRLGGQGADTLQGGSGDYVFGQGGDDSILATSGAMFAIAGDGNDTVTGAAGNDDLNGNRGEDVVHGGAGADLVRGGQGNDVVFGDDGNDVHVNGNIGDDTVHGGNGADTVYGGQGSDQVFGDDGDDYISGDRGSDTLTGGAGADTFHLGFNSDHDYVTDFGAGDRVLLDHNAVYVVSQAGPDTLVTLTTGEQITLQGVLSSTLADGWLVVG